MTALSVTLVGQYATLTPLSLGDVAGLVAAANQDRSSFGFTYVPDTEELMEEHVRLLLAEHDAGLSVPFTTRSSPTGDVVGMTRFLNLRWWFGRDVPDAAEIGGTFLGAAAQRTPVNTEAKYLMLGHAFDAWSVQRVDLKTDARNDRSRRAIERIGGRFEGTLRKWQPSLVAGEQGDARDSAMYSILAAEWTQVRQALEKRLG